MVEPADVALPEPFIVKTWENLSRYAEKYSRFGWLFRGVTSTKHLLIPRIGRKEWRKQYFPIPDSFRDATRPFRSEDETRLLEHFKREARPFINYTPSSDIEWLAIGQHHGLITRMLDWSQNLFVAAYFATEKGNIKQTARIYCVPEFKEYDADFTPIHPFSIEVPYMYRPPHISARIPAQHAIFTLHAQPDKALQVKNLQILDIPGEHCIKIKRMLDAAGFNRASLFPDLDGLGEHLSWRYKWRLGL